MLLTIFLTVVFSTAVGLMLLSAVAFIQDQKFFSSAPKEIQALIKPRPQELFKGARAMGWTLFVLSLLMASGVVVIAIWDGIRSNYTFWQFFLRFLIILTVYKLCDMILMDYFVLLKLGFFQYYYPEVSDVMKGRKYGFNIKSQLLKLLVVFPAISALIAWICTSVK